MKKQIISTLIWTFYSVAFSQSNSKSVPFDSIPDITITKLIYYQEPMIERKGSFASTEYKPVWADANSTVNGKYSPEESVKYYQRKLGKDLQGIIRIKNDTTISNKRAKYYNEYPVDYKFGEVWFTFNATGENVIMVLNTIKKKECSGIKFKDPGKINFESIDSLGVHGSPRAYINEDGIYKFADQRDIIERLNKADKNVDFSIQSFKGVLFRSKAYIKSSIQSGKRIFETVENSSTGVILKSTSDHL